MDNKKEFQASLIEAEKNEISDADTVDNENTSEEAFNETSDFSEELKDTAYETSEVSDTDVQAQVSKKSFIQIPIIISIVLVALVALGFFVVKAFFNTSIVGTWLYTYTASPDEVAISNGDYDIDYYYAFEKDGTASVTLGTIKYVGSYEVTYSDDNVASIEVYIPNTMQGTFEYTVTGNLFTGRTLTLTNTYYETNTVLTSIDYVVPEIEHEKDFEPNEKLTGTWIYDDGYNTLKYVFNEDGTAEYIENDYVYVTGYYSYTDDLITLDYYALEPTPMELTYQFVDDTIVINGIQCVRESAASSDEA